MGGALKNLPECTKALLETLGMDSTAVVWAAAAQRDKAIIGKVITVKGFRSLTRTFSFLMRCLGPPAAGGVTVVVSPTCEQARRQQLMLLVPATLLHWATNTRATTQDDLQQCARISRFGGDIISDWLQSSKVVVAELAGTTGLTPEAYMPWLQPYFPAAWLEQVLPDIQKLLTVLLQQPGGLQPPSSPSADGLVAKAPGRLVRLQCSILQSAICRDEQALLSEVPLGGSDSELCILRPVHGTDEQEVMQPLGEFCSVTAHILASLESFIRNSAQQMAAGSVLSSQAVPALFDIHAAFISTALGESGPLLSPAVAAGPGSPEQQQLYSLLSSLVKFSAMVTESSVSVSAQSASILLGCLIEVAISAGMALLECSLAQDLEGCDSSSSSSSTAAAQQPADAPTIPTAAAGSSTAPSAAAVALLPSLVLIGRCFLLWAQNLPQAVPQLLQLHARSPGSVPSLQVLMDSALDESISCSALAVVYTCFSKETFAGNFLQAAASCLLNWLTAPAVADQLAAAGHNTQQLPQLCQELMSANRTVTEAWASDGFTEATAMALVQQLQVTGRALAGLAVPTVCCNPSCGNVTGPSDLQVVSGRSCLCGGCRTARYCSRACQKAAWKQHKPACSALAGAAASAPGAAAESAPVPQAAS